PLSSVSFVSYLCGTSLLPSFFFFNHTATTDIYTLSLHDALPIFILQRCLGSDRGLHISLAATSRCPIAATKVSVTAKCPSKRLHWAGVDARTNREHRSEPISAPPLWKSMTAQEKAATGPGGWD